MNKRVLIVGHLSTTCVSAEALARLHIDNHDVLLVNFTDPPAKDIIDKFASNEQLKYELIKARSKPAKVRHHEVDHHPHIPKHLKRKYPRR